MYVRATLIIGIVFLASHCSIAQSRVIAKPRQNLSATRRLEARQGLESKQRLQHLYASLNAPWTDADLPYQTIRNNIEKALAQGANAASLLQQYEMPARQNPKDVKALFGWGYAVYWAATAPSAISERQANQELGDVYLAISRIQAPHTFNYDRLTFLDTACAVPLQALIPVGKRMLQRDPNDYDVKFYLTRILSVSRIAADRQQSLAYAQDLIEHHPSTSSVYGLLGYIYFESWWRSKSKADSDKATAAFQHYLRLAPPSYKRDQVQRIIRLMQKST